VEVPDWKNRTGYLRGQATTTVASRKCTTKSLAFAEELNPRGWLATELVVNNDILDWRTLKLPLANGWVYCLDAAGGIAAALSTAAKAFAAGQICVGDQSTDLNQEDDQA